MRKILLVALVALLWPGKTYSNNPADSLLRVLRIELAKKRVYDGRKESEINKLKARLNATNNLSVKYEAVAALYEAYQDYRFDARFKYAQLLIDLSKQLHDPRKLAENRLRLGTTLIASGMFKETFDCLRETNVDQLDNSLRKSYYILYSWAYSDLAKYNSDRFYAPVDMEKKFIYLDSAITLTTAGSFERKILEAQQKSDRKADPLQFYLELAKRKLSPHEEAMVVTGLSRYRKGEEKIRLLAIAAINDVRTSTYRAQAMLELGSTLFEQGRINEAYFFLQQAMDQANRYGSRMQRYEVAKMLPLVSARRDQIAQRERERFYIYLAVIITVAIITGLVCFIIFIQLKKVRAGERIIVDKNHALAEKNNQLWEEGRIKQEYIGFFFGELSRYILKLDKLKSNVQRKAKTGNVEDILKLLNTVDAHTDRSNLFHTFDKIFLRLFPDFVDAVNAMLPPEDQLRSKIPGTLSTNLRIFALMRLGIESNDMIAAILENSVSTVYTYRFRARSRALVPPEEFEQRIMGIQLARE